MLTWRRSNCWPSLVVCVRFHTLALTAPIFIFVSGFSFSIFVFLRPVWALFLNVGVEALLDVAGPAGFLLSLFEKEESVAEATSAHGSALANHRLHFVHIRRCALFPFLVYR